MKQTVSNACGTVAIIHAIANNVAQLEMGKYMQGIADPVTLRLNSRDL